ncbi:tail fiber domain-containing protein [Winogradskyella bathintestinalis]|uniref:Tail fiber domain-containing protein n=1 Tax=Winogradskyella bathintestinalis TaxID=3035208 RepID=A0ABT7ZWU4_9FLAO|nr:tail fiber domain-containing protein [Winogradskyella bathintestinalis]MDN3493447.1 tail fiber domain-containing protein [Winogradskyella bathintestinalis]
MKTLFTSFTILFISISSFAQQGINYKALIKDDLGNILADQPIGVQFQIREAAADGSAVYTEAHSTTTDANGIIILNIGTGSTTDTFSDIDWSGNEHWLNLQIDIVGGTNYADLSTTQFMTVPYALNAANAATKIDELEDAKSDADGSSLFIGVNAGLNDDSTINRNTGIGLNALSLNSTGSNNTAVGASALSKNSTGSRNTAIGSFAMLDNTAGSVNTAIGYDALGFNTTGINNIAIGEKALYGNIEGFNNTAIGTGALHQNKSSNNTANGFNALYLNWDGYHNTGIGVDALYSNYDGNNNTAVGHSALRANNNGDSNTAIGFSALWSNDIGYENTATGYQALYDNTTGSNNTVIGRNALYNNISGNYNIAIGSNSGLNHTSGSNNIFIGNFSGASVLANNNNKLFINNEASDNPLIYGEFDTNLIRIGGSLSIQNASDPTSTWRLQTRPNGSLALYRNSSYRGYFHETTGVYSSISDRKTKKDITALENGTLEKVMQLNPVSYLMKDQNDTKRNLGLISQEVQDIFPSITNYVEEADLITLSYTELIPVLIKALQEQQEIIEAQSAKDIIQDKSIEALVARLNIMESKSSN